MTWEILNYYRKVIVLNKAQKALVLLFFLRLCCCCCCCCFFPSTLRQASWIALTTVGYFWPLSLLKVRCFFLCYVPSHVQSTQYRLCSMEKCVFWAVPCCNLKHSFPCRLICRSMCAGMNKGGNGLSEQYLQKYPILIPLKISLRRNVRMERSCICIDLTVFHKSDLTGNENGTSVYSSLLDDSDLILTLSHFSGQTLSTTTYFFFHLRLCYDSLQIYSPLWWRMYFCDPWSVSLIAFSL